MLDYSINTKLKARIVLKYGSQANFAHDMKIDESVVSRVIRNRRPLRAKEQQRWATALDCNPCDIVPEK